MTSDTPIASDLQSKVQSAISHQPGRWSGARRDRPTAAVAAPVTVDRGPSVERSWPNTDGPRATAGPPRSGAGQYDSMGTICTSGTR